MKKRFGFLLVNEKGNFILEKLTESHKENIGFICSYPEMNVSENFSDKISALCLKNSIPCFERKNLLTFLSSNPNPPVSGLLAVGWQFLLPQEIDMKLEYGIHVFHDSLLPKYRGFAPTPSAIITGENEIGVTLLRVGKSIDDGPIFGQIKIELGYNDYVKDAIGKLTRGYVRLVEDFLNKINNGIPLQYIEQEDSQATYSIWRDESDYMIFWEQSAERIRNLIRATGPPYLGASTYLNGKKLRIYKADRITDINFEIRDPGKIWKIVDDNTVDVVCGKGMLRLTEVVYDENREKFKFNKLRSRFTNS